MIQVSNAFKYALANDQHNYLEWVDITLKDGTVLNLTNAEIWGGGFSIEDAVSQADTFGAIGAAIINSARVVINNIYDDYSTYDFDGAKVVMYIGLELDGEIERFKKGTFTVEDAQYNGDLITLECFDYMAKFDVPYSNSTLRYPATLNQIVRDACSVCDVNLNTYNFPRSNFSIPTRPEDEAVTFREVISWAAAIAGCFARCNVSGALEFKWFDQDSLEAESNILDGGTFDVGTPKYSSGAEADGGSFNPWNIGYQINIGGYANLENIHNIYSIFSHSISTDDIVITGVKTSVKVDGAESGQDIVEYMNGTEGYVVELGENGFITTANAQGIVNYIGNQLIGFKFRKTEAECSSNPTIEAGDVAFFWDSKSRISYPIIISRTDFTQGATQHIYSYAETPAKNSATRYTEASKSYIALRKQIVDEKTDREQAMETLANALAEKNGLYTTTEKGTGGSIYYLHNHPNLADSNIIWKMNAEAWGVSTDGGKTWNAGMTVDGDTIVRILTATGVNANWIKTGSMSAERITSGIMSADRIKGGTLSLGGSASSTYKNGAIRIYDANNVLIGRWDKDGLYATKGTFSGALSGATGTFQGSLRAATGTFAGNLSAAGGTFKGQLSAATGTFSGSLSAATGTFAGTLSAASGSFKGSLQAASGTFTGTITNTSGNQKTQISSGVSRYYWGDTYLGYIGSQHWKNESTKYGLMFGLSYAGKFMTWAAAASSSSDGLATRWSWVRETLGGYTKGLHAGDNIYMHGYRLYDSIIDIDTFRGWGSQGGITGTIQVATPSGGTRTLNFKRGILISG